MAEMNEDVPVGIAPGPSSISTPPPLPPPSDSPWAEQEPEAPLAPAPALPDITPAGEIDVVEIDVQDGNNSVVSATCSREIECGPKASIDDPGVVDRNRVKAKDLNQAQCLKDLHMSESAAPPQDEKELLDEFLHGIMRFEDTGLEAKFMLPPPKLQDPLVLFRALLGKEYWGLKPPNLAIEINEPYWDGEKQYVITDRDQPWRYLHLRPQDWNTSQQEEALMRYKLKSKSLSTAVVQASIECGAWLVSEIAGIVGCKCGNFFMSGVQEAQERVLGKKPIFLGFNAPNQDWNTIDESKDGCVLRNFEFDLRRVAEPLSNQCPTKRAVYPKVKHLLSGNVIKDHYFLNPACTHYIFFDKSHSTLRNRFLACFKNNSLLTPVSIVAGGMKNSFSHIQGIFSNAALGTTMVILDKTGPMPRRICQAIQDERQRRKGHDRDDGEGAFTESTDKIDKIAEEWGGFDMSPVSVPPGTPLDNFIILDGPQVSIDHVLSKLTTALSTVTSAEMSEFGFADAELERIEYAWKLYITFDANSRKHQKIATCMFATMVMTSVLTTTTAVLFAACQEWRAEGSNKPSGWEFFALHLDQISIISAILPLFSGFLLSLNTSLNPLVKASLLRTAAAETLGEIYHYRGRVGGYRGSAINFLKRLSEESQALAKPNLAQQHEQLDLEKGKNKPDIVPPREIFRQNLHQIHSTLMASDINGDALQAPVMADVQRVKSEVFNIVKLAPSYSSPEKTSDALHFAGGHGPLFAPKEVNPLIGIQEGGKAYPDHGDNDDGFTYLSGEDYTRFRLMPHLRKFAVKAPRYAYAQKVTTTLLLMITLATAILALTGKTIWMPIAVGLGSAVTTVTQHVQLSEQLRKTNMALAALKDKLMWWQSLPLVGRRLEESKQQLITEVEAIILSEDARSLVGARSKARVPQMANNDDKEKDDEDGNKQKTK